jgi:tetratricopeptide (TPR) repeat protein
LSAALCLVLLAAVPAICQKAIPTAKDNTSEAHLGKGYEALKQDRYEDAVQEFRAALRLDPTLMERARFPLGVALFEMHRFAESRRELETLQRTVGDHPNILYYLGRLDLESGNFDAAVRNLNKAADKPPLPDTFYYLGFAYLQQGDLPSAEKWLKEAERINPRDSRIPFQLGTVYRKQGRDEDAKKAMARSGELRRRDNDEVQMRVECAQKLDQGPRDEARAFCDQLYDPENAERLTKLGTIYGEHGDVEAALKPLRRAAELVPQSPQMQYNVAYAYYQLNQFGAARPPLETAIKRWPDLFQLNALYGAVLFKLGETVPAYQALSRAHALNPQDAVTVQMLYATALTLATASQDAKRFSESLRYLQEAAKLGPKEPEPHHRMADVYTHMGRTAEASAEQREAERLSKP